MQSGTESVEPLGRRERNRRQVRERIYAAGITLFTRHGYDDTTVDEIAELADVARGTFFNHFQRKEDLITEWTEKRRQVIREQLPLAPALEDVDSPTLLRRCVTVLARLNEDEHVLTKTMVTAWVKAGKPLSEAPHTAVLFTRIIEAGAQRGEVRAGADPVLIGELLRDCYLGALFRWTRASGEPGDLDRELRAVVDVILGGIAVSYTPE